MTASSGTPSHRLRWFGLSVLIFALAVGVRARLLYELHDDPTSHDLVHDELVNDTIARMMVDGTLPQVSLYKAPLYTVVLAGIYQTLGTDHTKARWIMIFVYGLTPVVMMLLAKRLFGSAAGIIAGLVGATQWAFAFYAVQLMDTSLACLLYVLLAYLLVAVPEDRWFKWPVCGFVLGLGAITRPNILAAAPPLALAVLVYGWYRRRREVSSERATEPPPGLLRTARRPFLNAVALTLGCCLAVLPVTLRNVIVSGEASLIGTYGGLNFYVANSPWSDGKNGALIVGEGPPDISARDPNNLWSVLDLNYSIAKTYAQKQTGQAMTMAEVDAFFYDLTWQYIWAHPRKFALDYLKRFCWFFNAHEFSNLKMMYRLRDVSPTLDALALIHNGVVSPLAILGACLIVATRYRASGLVYFAVITGALVLSGPIFVMNSRFRVPALHLIVPFATFGLTALIGLMRPPVRWRLVGFSFALLACAIPFANLDLFGYSKGWHLELRMTYAQACRRLGRHDLLRQAVEGFETAYFDEIENQRGHPWANTLHHAVPMAQLFHHYLTLAQQSGEASDVAKALRYGRLMIEYEPYQMPACVAYFQLLMNEGRPEEAKRVLGVFETNLEQSDPSVAIRCFMQYQDKYDDPEIAKRLDAILERVTGR